MRAEVKVGLQAEMVPAGKQPGHLKKRGVIKAVMATRQRCQLPEDTERSREIKVTYLLLSRQAGPLPKACREPAAGLWSPASHLPARQGKGIVTVKRRISSSTNVGAEAALQSLGSAAGDSVRTGALTKCSRSDVPIYLEIKLWYVNSLRSKETVKQNS